MYIEATWKQKKWNRLSHLNRFIWIQLGMEHANAAWSQAHPLMSTPTRLLLSMAANDSFLPCSLFCFRHSSCLFRLLLRPVSDDSFRRRQFRFGGQFQEQRQPARLEREAETFLQENWDHSSLRRGAFYETGCPRWSFSQRLRSHRYDAKSAFRFFEAPIRRKVNIK